MSLKGAFNLLLSLHGRTVELTRFDTPTDLTVTVRIAPSNYSRNLEGPSESVIPGKEFVVSKEALDIVSFPAPKRGDRIEDDDMGEMTITEVREMFDFGGALIGYRLRTS